ncbi:ABC transporter permease [Streptomyces lunaelactis]|uniref:ABC transporter permease n=1 Tax=Streptomyces lunaelactis TaxID=1535768 RepID=UPI00158490C2|nr:ABC transporter permease [Streptomyces lunaelactis]NUK04437.1 ABC transporter permease [Streptomyces lunaelactis]NUK11215.1 ABC transporter permease [Streptomyces lunaelactis]NUK16563.1 ABC transporter permease [Streptomyces lunaelactis]NUK27508.1 ABC transporter permease [Streptomyces lunaelactis]NUK35123.1 ABC transporter permease [Streptomyces lunaelactis]
MISYILRRIIAAVILLLVVTAVTFGIFFVLPKLAGQTVDQLAQQYIGKNPTPEDIAAVKQNLGLDQPIYIQYWDFIKGIVVGADYDLGPTTAHCSAPCFGYSFKDHVEVWPQLMDRLPVTISLASGAAVIWLLSGVTAGVISALKPGSIFDRAAMGISLAGVSLPMFFTGQLALLLFSYKLEIFGRTYVSFTENPAQWANTLFLPWCSLALLYSAIYARLTRSGMLETMNEDFIRTARAKGLRERNVIARHGLRAALTPIITVFGMDLGLLLGGALITESVFSLHGIGEYAVQGITANDLPPILGVTLVAAFFVVICNLLVDLLYAAVDPRVRLS